MRAASEMTPAKIGQMMTALMKQVTGMMTPRITMFQMRLGIRDTLSRCVSRSKMIMEKR